MKNETARREIESLDYYLQNHTNDYSEESHTAMMMAIDALSRSEIPNTCGDAISRQEALNAITMAEVRWQAVDNVNKLPSVTLQQRTGRWIPVGYDGYADGNPVYDWWECSKCGWEHSGDEESLTAFCPNCGTKMEVEE